MPAKSTILVKHPIEQCETMVRSIVPLLSVGNDEGARIRLETIIRDLNKEDTRELISESLGMRISNMFDKQFGIHYLDQIEGISMNELLNVRSISYTLIYKIETALRRRGLTFRQTKLTEEKDTDYDKRNNRDR